MVHGEPSPTPGLGQWRFAAEPRLRAALHQRLSSCPPLLTAHVDCPVIWGWRHLGLLGERVDRLQRVPWHRQLQADGPQDARAQALWEAWLRDDTAAVWHAWPEVYGPSAYRGFSAVLRAVGMPREVQRQRLELLGDELPMMMLGWRDTVPGWCQVASWVLESAGQAPLTAMAGALLPAQLALVADCAVRRGYQPATVRLAYPEAPRPELRALALRDELERDPAWLETLVDLHVAVRLIDRWHAGHNLDLESSWDVVVANRGRARARIRSILAGDRAALQRILKVDSLHARTCDAVMRWAREWAWQLHRRRWESPTQHPVDAPCAAAATAPLDDDETLALRAWVLLVCLKGRHTELRAWTFEGTGIAAGTWGRLLADELPESLRDALQPGRKRRGLGRVRAGVAEHWDSLLDHCAGVLEALSILPQDGLKEAAPRLLAQVGHTQVAFPSRGYEAIVRRSAMIGRTLRAWREAP